MLRVTALSEEEERVVRLGCVWRLVSLSMPTFSKHCVMSVRASDKHVFVQKFV